MEFTERTPNRLRDYDYSTTGAYFVTLCTQNRKKILSNIVGGGAHDAPNVVLTDIGKIVEVHIVNSKRIPGITIDKFVIMPDHIHLIILVDENAVNETSRAPSPTNAVIPHLVSTFKRFCHRDVGEKIFQRSYYDHVIRNVLEIEKYVIMPDHIRMTIRLDNGSMWASTPTRNKLIDLFRKKIFERIMRPHPCAQTLEKGCGLTYGTKTRITPKLKEFQGFGADTQNGTGLKK